MLADMAVTTTRRTPLGPAYWRLWWASAVSTTGDGVLVAALPLLAVTITRDPLMISLVTAAEFLPWLLLSLPVGVLVDRHDRATLMRRAQVLQGSVIAVLTLLVAARWTDIAVLAAAAFGLGIGEVVFSNASQSVLPQLVRAEQLPQANGNQYAVQTIGQEFAGPPLGSLLFAAAAAAPFGLSAASFAGSAALLTKLPRQPAETVPDGTIRSRVAEGLRWLLGNRLLRVVAIVLGVNAFCNTMGLATLVLLVTETLKVSSRFYGVLLAAAAVGSVLGGLLNPRLTRRLGQVPSLLIAMGSISVVYVGIGLAPDAAVIAVLEACNGFMATMWNVVTVTLRQSIVPNHMLGRVNSAYRMIGWGLMPAGAVAGGFVAHVAGLRAPYVLAGILCGIATLAALPLLLRGGVSHGAALAREPRR
jgi:MFS family permease